MSQIIYTITKESASVPWMIAQAPYAEACCTEYEMLNIITPYREAVAALPGLVSKNIVEVNDTVLEITYIFDTEENRISGVNYLNTEQSGRKELMAAKRLAANIQYTQTSVVS